MVGHGIFVGPRLRVRLHLRVVHHRGIGQDGSKVK
jgi:hypothetical protein